MFHPSRLLIPHLPWRSRPSPSPWNTQTGSPLWHCMDTRHFLFRKLRGAALRDDPLNPIKPSLQGSQPTSGSPSAVSSDLPDTVNTPTNSQKAQPTAGQGLGEWEEVAIETGSTRSPGGCQRAFLWSREWERPNPQSGLQHEAQACSPNTIPCPSYGQTQSKLGKS